MKSKTIHSIKEDEVVEARFLHTAKNRLALGKFLVEGEEQIRWALANHCTVYHVFAVDSQVDHPLYVLLVQKSIPILVASEGIIKKISDTSYLIPFIAVAAAPRMHTGNNELVVVLDGVQDFGNIGTIVRTAEAFGVTHFVATKEDFDWFYKKAIDASRGTIFGAYITRYASGRDAINALKKQGYQVAVTTLRASIMQSFVRIDDKPLAVVLGNESTGVSDEVEELADVRIQIPMSGNVESLNVGVAAGISLYELKIQWILAMLTKKIKESIARDLYCVSQWMRRIFDAQLKAISPFNADQAIMMMILHCEGSLEQSTLAAHAGVSDAAHAHACLELLNADGFISLHAGHATLQEKGQKALASVWSVHERVEQMVFQHISPEHRTIFLDVVRTMMNNCENIMPYE